MLGLVGKGITFDSGGISIKPADGMERMKRRHGGRRGRGRGDAARWRGSSAPFRVIGIIPTSENMPGGTAIRPGDVIRGASGKTVEIINTDAEGRLILADALWYARQLGATHLVDVATLTGASWSRSGAMSRVCSARPTRGLRRCGRRRRAAGDRLWPMPIYEEAREQFRSEIADLVNSAGRGGRRHHRGGVPARVRGGRPWAHLDIAGTAWAETKEPYQPKGATGVAVRTLTELGMTGGVGSGIERTDRRQVVAARVGAVDASSTSTNAEQPASTSARSAPARRSRRARR